MSMGLFVFIASFFMDKFGRKATFFLCLGVFLVGIIIVLSVQDAIFFIFGMVVLKIGE